MDIPAHPLAAIFPMLDEADAADLVASVRRRWLVTNRITCLGRQILDGRNRYLACLAAGLFSLGDLLDDGLPPEGHQLWLSHFRRFVAEQDGDPIDFVEAQNLHRRDLCELQRALIANDLASIRAGRPLIPLPGAGPRLVFTRSEMGVSRVDRRGSKTTIKSDQSGPPPDGAA